jgi:hypothetical protein
MSAELFRMTTITTLGGERVAAGTQPPSSLESFEQEKSPGRVSSARLVQRVTSVGMYAHIYHGWQFACKVATGGKVCGITSAKP